MSSAAPTAPATSPVILAGVPSPTGEAGQPDGADAGALIQHIGVGACVGEVDLVPLLGQQAARAWPRAPQPLAIFSLGITSMIEKNRS